MALIPVRPVVWNPCYRIVPASFPQTTIFARVAPATDWDALLELEGMTGGRVQGVIGAGQADRVDRVDHVDHVDRVGWVSRVDPVGGAVLPNEWPAGTGTGLIMAAFTQVAPGGARFSDGTFGAYYAARDRETALAEAIFHRTRFLGATRQRPLRLEWRILEARLSGELHDLRGLGAELPGVYDPDDYAAARALARRLRGDGSAGVAYDSLRHEGGECAAIFRPSLLSHCMVTHRLSCLWDGERVTALQEGPLTPLRSGPADEGGGAGSVAA